MSVHTTFFSVDKRAPTVKCYMLDILWSVFLQD